MTCRSEIELLTVEEFALRLRVGRSTVFLWIASKKMILGIHYFKIVKTVRIPWSLELLASLSIDSDKTEKTSARAGKNQGMVNLDY